MFHLGPSGIILIDTAWHHDFEPDRRHKVIAHTRHPRSTGIVNMQQHFCIDIS